MRDTLRADSRSGRRSPALVISDDAAVYANFTPVAKVLGSSVAQGDQADAAGAEQSRSTASSPIACWRFIAQACRVQRDGRLGRCGPGGQGRRAGRRDSGVVRAAVGFGVAAARRRPENDYRLVGQRSDAADAGQATVHVRDGQGGRATERRQPARGRHEQRSGTNAAQSRPRPATRDGRTRPPSAPAGKRSS